MKTELPDFDVLVRMAREEPERLEALRKELTQSIIQSAKTEDSRRRLEGLQFQVDMMREKSGTPLAACIRISEMMARSLGELHRSMVAPEEVTDRERGPAADVIPLRRKEEPLAVD